MQAAFVRTNVKSIYPSALNVTFVMNSGYHVARFVDHWAW